MTHAHYVEARQGDTFDLGLITLRMLVGTDQTNGTLAVGEFSGKEEGPWTVLHVHERSEEAFYIVEGGFLFTLGDDEVEAGPGSFIAVPRGIKHMMRGMQGGGTLLTIWTPGGLEEMFKELSRLPSDSLRNPEVRKAISARFDSKPV